MHFTIGEPARVSSIIHCRRIKYIVEIHALVQRSACLI